MVSSASNPELTGVLRFIAFTSDEKDPVWWRSMAEGRWMMYHVVFVINKPKLNSVMYFRCVMVNQVYV